MLCSRGARGPPMFARYLFKHKTARNADKKFRGHGSDPNFGAFWPQIPQTRPKAHRCFPGVCLSMKLPRRPTKVKSPGQYCIRSSCSSRVYLDGQGIRFRWDSMYVETVWRVSTRTIRRRNLRCANNVFKLVRRILSRPP